MERLESCQTPQESAFDSSVGTLARYIKIACLTRKEKLRLIFAHWSLWYITRKTPDGIYFSCLRETLKQTDESVLRDWEGLLDGWTKEIRSIKTHGKFEQLGWVKTLRGFNTPVGPSDKVGLKFGHYRRLTLPHMFEALLLRRFCDKLILVAESGERTRKFKSNMIELSDLQRAHIFYGSGLFDEVYFTTGNNYTNSFYRELVLGFVPNILFYSASWPEEVVSEYKKRAIMAGADSFGIPNFLEELSTTAMERVFMSNDMG